jgi:hypothetical protein
MVTSLSRVFRGRAGPTADRAAGRCRVASATHAALLLFYLHGHGDGQERGGGDRAPRGNLDRWAACHLSWRSRSAATMFRDARAEGGMDRSCSGLPTRPPVLTLVHWMFVHD